MPCSGIPSEIINSLDFWHQQTLPITEQRQLLTKLTVSHLSSSVPRTRYEYSNSNYIIAGAILEKLNDISWEELIEKRLFKPLGMTSTGFGPMGSRDNIEQPWAHQIVDDDLIPVYADNPPVLGPAGRVHCSITDWAKYAIFILAGVRGKSLLLKPSTIKELITPPYLDKKNAGSDYASGWLWKDLGKTASY